MEETRWRKSSRSVGNPEQCVEVGSTPRRIYVRDSKNRSGPTLEIPPASFAGLMTTITTGLFTR